jgi:hypothetical protein
VTIRLASTREVDGNRHNKNEQQCQCPNRADRCSGERKERDCNQQLCEGQENSKRTCECAGNAKLAECSPRSGEIGELSNAGDAEDACEE